MTKTELAQEIYRLSHLTGQFVLRSGQTSTEYFDKYRFESQPRTLREIARQMAPLIPKGTEILAGLEMGGIPIATAISLETGLPVAFVRKEAKSYGTCQLAEGADLRGRQICVIEDVITTGGQVVTSAKALKELGGQINAVLCVIYRGQNPIGSALGHEFTVKALFTKAELEDALT